MTLPRIPPHLGKPDAARLVAAAAGLPELDPYWGPVAKSLEQAERLFGPACNAEITFAASAPALQEIVLARGHDRVLPPPGYLNGRPDCFPGFPGMWPSGAPTLRGFVLPNAYYCLIADAPVAISAERRAIAPIGPKFARLLHFYDAPLEPLLSDAPFIDGTALALVDDVFGLNYCHWICDWLSRLAPFRDVLGRDDFFVLTSPITTDWQRRTLELCGVASERVAMRPWQAVRARELITLSDISEIHHPMQKGAVWAMSFLRDRLLAPVAAKAEIGQCAAARKIYVSRGDAGGRRVLNEDALMALLGRHGYEKVAPGELDFDAQAALFAEASHIIGLHGAGLTNIIFAPSHCRVIEILPRSYGTPAFCVLAGARGMPYYTYVEGAVTASTDSQADDITIDVADFARCAEVLL
jgi:capsular polysaccharide biosynthesis protein